MKDPRFVVLAEVPVARDLSVPEGLSRRQVGGIDLRLAFADPESAAYPAHMDLIVADILAGRKAHHIDAGVGKIHFDLRTLADIESILETVERLGRKERGVPAQQRLVRIGIAFVEIPVVDQFVNPHVNPGDIARIDVVRDTLGRGHRRMGSR